MKDAKKYLKKLSVLKEHILFIFIILFAAMYGYVIYAATQNASREPKQADILEGYETVARPKLDEDVANQLLDLEEQNIEIKALFDEARNNPFVE